MHLHHNFLDALKLDALKLCFNDQRCRTYYKTGQRQLRNYDA